MADVERERVTALWREAAGALDETLESHWFTAADRDSWKMLAESSRVRADAAEAECGRLRERLHTCCDDYHRKVIALQAEVATLKRTVKDSVPGDDPMVLPSESRADSQAGLTGPGGSLNPGTEPDCG